MGRHRESESQTRRHSQYCDIQAAEGACGGHRDDHRRRRPSSPQQHQQHHYPAAAYSSSGHRAKSVAATGQGQRCCNCNHAEPSAGVAPVCVSGGGGGGGGGGGATVSAAASASGGVGGGVSGGSHRSCRGSSCAKRLQHHHQQQQQQQQQQQHQNLAVADDPDGLGRAMRLANWSMLQKPPVVIGSKRPKEAPEWRGGGGSGGGSGFAGGHRSCTRLS